jgi:HD-GYP domain-containing protein (c-di-GMP phosphodiesterase class II)
LSYLKLTEFLNNYVTFRRKLDYHVEYIKYILWFSGAEIMIDLRSFDSIEFRMFVQIMSFIVSLIVTQMAMVEWRRNNNVFYKYLALGFGIMFIEITMMTVVLIFSFLTGTAIDIIGIPVIDHVLRTSSYIYLAAAFTTVKASYRSRFVKINLISLFIFAPIYLFLSSLSLYNPGQSPINAIGDLIFEVWNTGLIIHTINTILNSNLRIKKGLSIATSVLLIKQAIHFVNTALLHQTLPYLILLERFMVVIYLYAIIITLHKEIIADLLHIEAEKNMMKERSHLDTIRALVNSLEAKDEYTRGHSDRVTEYAMVIGIKLGLDNEELTRLYYGAILHDIGKIGISEDILNSADRLCTDEFDSIKKHPEIGANIVFTVDILRNVAPAILHHHEWYDGSGYPMWLKGSEIPLHARIIAISDALDAMSSNRTYRISLTEEKALAELVRTSGTQFDPQLVRIFVEAMGLNVRNLTKPDLNCSA